MSEALETPPKPGVLERRRFPSLIWLVPLVAALIGLSMLVHAWLSAGPEITLVFQAATGLEAGKTPVKYKDVTVGLVSRITLSEDGSHVLVSVSMDNSAENLVRADLRRLEPLEVVHGERRDVLVVAANLPFAVLGRIDRLDGLEHALGLDSEVNTLVGLECGAD